MLKPIKLCRTLNPMNNPEHDNNVSLFEIRSAVRFLAISGLSFLLNPGLSALLHEILGLPIRAAYAIALVTVFLVNFVMMRHVVFGKTQGSARAQFVGFGAATLLFRAAEYTVFLIVPLFINIHYLVLIICISAVFTILKYFLYGNTIFRARKTE